MFSQMGKNSREMLTFLIDENLQRSSYAVDIRLQDLVINHELKKLNTKKRNRAPAKTKSKSRRPVDDE